MDVVGSIVAGLPPSAEQPQRGLAADRASLASVAETEVVAGKSTTEQLRSESSRTAGEAAGQWSQGEGQAAGGARRGGASRKRSSQSVPLETVPEQAEKVKRPKRLTAAAAKGSTALAGLPPKKGASGEADEEATAAQAVAGSHEDAMAAELTQGAVDMPS